MGLGIELLEGPGLQPLVPDDQPITVKMEDLDPISATVEEEEEMAGQEVLERKRCQEPLLTWPLDP
jgi:hypothetical protein